jgi:hypothetical protein
VRLCCWLDWRYLRNACLLYGLRERRHMHGSKHVQLRGGLDGHSLHNAYLLVGLPKRRYMLIAKHMQLREWLDRNVV